MEKALLSHSVDKNFLKYGFVIPQTQVIAYKDIIEKAVAAKIQIKVEFSGGTYHAIIDNPRSTLYRLMFRADLKKAFLSAFTGLYDTITKDDNTVDYEIKQGESAVVAFYQTNEEYVWVAKKIETDVSISSENIAVNPKEMKSAYKKYLDGLTGKFSAYVNAIEKDFITNFVKEKYNVESAYCITSSSIIRDLVKTIRSDTKLNQLDLASSSRCPSCSLLKYADFLDTNNEVNTIREDLPFAISDVINSIADTGLIFDPLFVKRFVCSLLTKPFVILSGLTGSGKTQLAMAFPKFICESSDQYKIIPVGADWLNREPLLGYPNALRSGEYVMPDNGALKLIIEASKPENQKKPYFLILDEMNMSYVERYFADFLSAMESGEEIPLWVGNDIVPATIKLPKNLFIIGTINVDETTYQFSPKVLDRANVLEFRINIEQMNGFLNGPRILKPIENYSGCAADFISLTSSEFEDSLTDEMKKTLVSMFETLSKIQKEFGYRTAHEMARYIFLCKQLTDMDDKDAIDSAMVQKLLPKLHGSRKKITPILAALWRLCYQGEPAEIESLDVMPIISTFKYPLTAEKIWRMFQIAQDNGFTSFAEA